MRLKRLYIEKIKELESGRGKQKRNWSTKTFWHGIYGMIFRR